METADTADTIDEHVGVQRELVGWWRNARWEHRARDHFGGVYDAAGEVVPSLAPHAGRRRIRYAWWGRRTAMRPRRSIAPRQRPSMAATSFATLDMSCSRPVGPRAGEAEADTAGESPVEAVDNGEVAGE